MEIVHAPYLTRKSNIMNRRDKVKREKKVFYTYENTATGDNKFVMKELELYGRHRNCFLTKEEATAHFEESYRIASDRYEKIMEGISQLKESVGDFYYNYFMFGDTHGIYDDGLYIEILVNGYYFQFPQEEDWID